MNNLKKNSRVLEKNNNKILKKMTNYQNAPEVITKLPLKKICNQI